MKRFNNKYRIQTARLPDHDYTSNGDYFITICTADRIQYFGKISEKEMILSKLGSTIEVLILKLTMQFQNIRIVEYIIMPDHVHFIIKIDKPKTVETRLIASLRNELRTESENEGGITGNANPMLQEGIPKMVRWFKGRATFELRKINPEFAWQARYYDKVIRNKKEYFAIIQYIKSNPGNWDNHFYFFIVNACCIIYHGMVFLI